MQHFSLQLEAMSPLAIRADHAPGGVENASYISGSTLLGSLAALHRMTHPGDTAAFEQLFLSGQVQFPNLYPASFQHDDFTRAGDLPIYPLPKTAQSCKRFPGFKPLKGEEVDEKRHGVRDSLLDWAVLTLGSKANEAGRSIKLQTLLKPLQDQKKCSCNEPIDHFSGYYRRIYSDGIDQLAKAEAETRLQTRTGINRATGTVQESILYSLQVFEEHVRFWGMVQVEDELAQPLQSFINEIGESGLMRIGTGRSRGIGKAHLHFAEIAVDEQDKFDNFKRRIAKLDTELRDQVKAAFGSLELKPLYFALTLHSPVIAHDDLLRYRGVIDAATLAEMLHMSASTFALEYQNASTRHVMGWNELYGMPRKKEIAIESGSVFLFATNDVPDDTLWRALFELEETGVGRHRAEGFGRICVSDLFHLEVKLK